MKDLVKMCEVFDPVPSGIWRLHEDVFPHGMGWARAIEKDIPYQERMGAFRCDACDAIVKYNEFYCKNCSTIKRYEKELDKQQQEKEKTMKFLRKK
jgi:hypothetical protein